MALKKLLVIACILCAGWLAWAYESTFTLYGTIRHDAIVTNAGLRGGIGWELSSDSMGFTSKWELRNYAIGERKVTFPHMANDVPLLADFTYHLEEGYFWIDWETVYAQIGYIHLSEGVGSHYPLWIAPNSSAYPAVAVEWNPVHWFTLKNDFVFIRPDVADWKTDGHAQIAKTLYYRRAAFRPWEFLELGYEEAILFLGRSIDPAYAFALFPYQMTQEFRNNFKDAPWRESINDNGMQGLYLQLFLDPVHTWASVFISDLNITKIWAPNDKFAWNIGTQWQIDPRNSLAIEFAGSTKYNYQRHSLGIPPYAYVRYEDQTDLPIEYNMIGYQYGPNSGVVNLEYRFHEEDYGLSVMYEFLVHGKRDPYAQWDEPGGTQPDFTYFPWLDDPVLQNNHTFMVGGYWNFHPQASVQASIGFTFCQNYGLEAGKTHWMPRLAISGQVRF